MPSPGGQKHHYLGSTAIHPHWEPWECLTVERVCWISYRDFTTHSVKKWGFSLGLIRLATREWMERRLELFGHEPKPVSYFFCVFFPGKRNIHCFSRLLKEDTFLVSFASFWTIYPLFEPRYAISLRMSWARQTTHIDIEHLKAGLIVMLIALALLTVDGIHGLLHLLEHSLPSKHSRCPAPPTAQHSDCARRPAARRHRLASAY